MGYKSIKDQIVAILETVSSVKAVYPKEAKMLNDGGFPAATVEAKGHTSEFYSVGPSGNNQRVYEHYVRVYFRTDETNNPDYEDVLESVAEDVVNAFETNITLNNTVLWSIPLSGEWRDGQKESPVRYIEIVLASTIQAAR